jgi:ABC-type branched-subunit amino acid transport system ATPase component
VSDQKPRLDAEGVVVEYGRGRAVDGFSFTVRPGQAVGLVGANGAGKSSLLRCIAGLQRPQAGTIRFDGHDVTRKRAWTLSRRGLRLVPETRELFWNLSVIDNLRLGTVGMSSGARNESIERGLEIFPALRPLLDRRARLLSGGEQQMLALGRALVGRPSLLLVDEPTLGLAPRIVADMIVALRRIVEDGVSIVIGEQNLALPRALCDEVILLKLGREVAAGSPREVFDAETLRTAFLGSTV